MQFFLLFPSLFLLVKQPVLLCGHGSSPLETLYRYSTFTQKVEEEGVMMRTDDDEDTSLIPFMRHHNQRLHLLLFTITISGTFRHI